MSDGDDRGVLALGTDRGVDIMIGNERQNGNFREKIKTYGPIHLNNSIAFTKQNLCSISFT